LLDDIVKMTFSPMESISSFFYGHLMVAKEGNDSTMPPQPKNEESVPHFFLSILFSYYGVVS